MAYSFHIPDGNPCVRCGLPPDLHYPSHTPKAGCCLAPAKNHKTKTDSYLVGLDGEGQGRSPHRYTLLAYSDAAGKNKDTVKAPKGQGLSSAECLEFLVNIPRRARPFAFAFNYDLTKILTDLPNREIYQLLRPETRDTGKRGPRPVIWNGFRLNWQAGKFTVARKDRHTVIWDIFRFFQSKFTRALIDWKVADESKLLNMERMKSLRSQFDTLSDEEVTAYCLDECRYMALLAARLIKAHNDAALGLRSYHGAGSSASAMLTKMGIRDHKRDNPPEMTTPLAQSFFGGRFEHSFTGSYKAPVYAYDIASAYPYQIYQLPCLNCATWEYTTDETQAENACHALYSWSLRHVSGPRQSWYPLPFRDSAGAITYPASIGRGWTWQAEYKAARKGWPSQVKFLGAFINTTPCDHRPFADVPSYYLERLKLGKEGPGIVLKLATNSLYGKTAQTVGRKPPFRCPIWASMITSGCRAQLLDLMMQASSPDKILGVATDSVFSTERLTPPTPVDTGTQNSYGKPELGAWEEKIYPAGLFLVRPGIYFPLDDSQANVRARGIGREALFRTKGDIISAFERGESVVNVNQVARFNGAKTCVYKVPSKSGPTEYRRSPTYGEWDEKVLRVSFDPMPKRERILPDGSLLTRDFAGDLESVPYGRALVRDSETLALIQADLEASEQPDGYEFSWLG